MLRVDSDKPSLVWQSKKVSEMDTDGLHSVMSTPCCGERIHLRFVQLRPVRCLKADTGERVWETFRTDHRQIRALGQRLHC